MKRLRAAVVTNVPAPYRVPMLQRVADCEDIELHVVYCADPHIDVTLGAGAHCFATHWLGGRYKAGPLRFTHSSFGVVRVLRDIAPQVVVTTGFIPTFLYAHAWCRRNAVPHVAMTDGTVMSEQHLSAAHRWIRRHVWAHSAAFAGASEGSLDLFRAAGAPADRQFKVHLAVDNGRFEAAALPATATALDDFLFSGRLLPFKGPAFALEVAAATARRLGRRVSLRFIGEGEELANLQSMASNLQSMVETSFGGYLPQAQLPQVYASARLFLFPTRTDTWGVVANEACASGVPVLVSPYAGVAGELVRDGRNGRVLPLDVDTWAAAAAELLTDETLRRRMGAAAQMAVRGYTFDLAAEGLANALRRAVA